MMHNIINVPWVCGLFTISGLFGLIVAFISYVLLELCAHRRLPSLADPEFWTTGVLTGVVERAFFTLMIGLLGAGGIPAAVVGWIAVKGQLHYQIFTKEKPQIGRVYVGILCSLVSLSCAVLGGYVWSHGLTLNALIAHISHKA